MADSAGCYKDTGYLWCQTVCNILSKKKTTGISWGVNNVPAALSVKPDISQSPFHGEPNTEFSGSLSGFVKVCV